MEELKEQLKAPRTVRHVLDCLYVLIDSNPIFILYKYCLVLISSVYSARDPSKLTCHIFEETEVVDVFVVC